MLGPVAGLRAVKAVHTLAWACFAFCILAIPVFAWRGQFCHRWRSGYHRTYRGHHSHRQWVALPSDRSGCSLY